MGIETDGARHRSVSLHFSFSRWASSRCRRGQAAPDSGQFQGEGRPELAEFRAASWKKNVDNDPLRRYRRGEVPDLS